MKSLASACLLLAMACPAQADGPVYRCGNEYSRQPCPGGRIVEATDPRSAAQRAEARRIAAEDRRRAAAMERDRLAQEKRIKPAKAAGIRPLPAPEDAASKPARGKSANASSAARSAAKKGKEKAEPDFVAVEPRPAKPARPARPASAP